MYKLATGGVIHPDGAFVPDNEGNRHWQEYLAWLGKGNEAQPADEPSLDEAKVRARAKVMSRVDKQIAQSGFLPESKFAAEIVSDIAFMIGEWTGAGRPDTMPANIAVRVETEAAAYGITPLQMIQVWEQKWLGMRAGLANILAQRRAWLLAIDMAPDVAAVKAVEAKLQ